MRLNIAVIGSGMAGLAAARILQDAGHHITVFEALHGRGMDSHSLDFEGGVIDSPLRVMNPKLWANTLSLATSLGIQMYPVRTFMSCTWLDEGTTAAQRETWLTTSRLPYLNLPIIKNWQGFEWQKVKQYTAPLAQGFLQYQKALTQFFKLPETEQQQMSLAMFMNRYNIEPLFWHGTVMPVLYTICTCDAKTMGDWPARPLLEFLKQLTQGEPLLRMYGGTPALVSQLIDGIEIISGSPVTAVQEQQNGQVQVENTAGLKRNFDRVIVATPTTQLQFLDADQFADDIALVKQFKFQTGELVIHSDANCMPTQRKDWSVLSYHMDRHFNQQTFTVWINVLEPTLVGKSDVFQTWNPQFELDEAKVIAKVKLSRAVVDAQTAKLNQHLDLRHQAPVRKVFFIGSWACDGLPILESAVTSAMRVAEHLGAKVSFKGLKPKVAVDPSLGY